MLRRIKDRTKKAISGALSGKSGFTLIELIIVIAIIVALCMILASKFF